MNPETQRRVLNAWLSRPADIRRAAATREELEAFENQFGRVPQEFRWFLETCGGGVVGKEWVDGIAELVHSHAKFAAERGGSHGWTMTDVFIIGWDGGGNPFGIHIHSGAIIVEDHTFGGIHQMAMSFEAFLVDGLLKRGAPDA